MLLLREQNELQSKYASKSQQRRNGGFPIIEQPGLNKRDGNTKTNNPKIYST